MRTCPSCSLTNPDSAIVCDCGHVLDGVAATSLPPDALRPPEPPRRHDAGPGLGLKIFVGFFGYVFASMVFGLVRAALTTAIPLPTALAVPTGVAGAAFALTMLGRAGATSAARLEKGRRRSYLSRHWRGELSLGVSYWINGWLLSLVGAGVAGGFAEVARSETPYGRIVLGVAFWILVAAGEVWYFVGTWRSADRPTPGGWISSWSGLAKASLVIGATFSVAVTVAQWWPALRSSLEQARAMNQATGAMTASARRAASPRTDQEVEALLDGNALYRAIKGSNPSAHDEIVRQVRFRLERGDSLADVGRAVRAILSPIFTKALPDASDEALRRLGELLMKEVAELERAAPELCGRAGAEAASDVVAHLSPDTLKEEGEVTARVIASSASGRPTVGANRARTLFERAVRQARAAAAPGSDATSACRNATALYAAVLALPPQDGADLLRAMFTRPADFEPPVRPRPNPSRRRVPAPAPELRPSGEYRLRLRSRLLEDPG